MLCACQAEETKLLEAQAAASGQPAPGLAAGPSGSAAPYAPHVHVPAPGAPLEQRDLDLVREDPYAAMLSARLALQNSDRWGWPGRDCFYLVGLELGLEGG